MNKLITTLALITCLSLSAQSSATPMSAFDGDYAIDTWDLEGPKAKLRTNRNKSKATFNYNANKMGFQPFTWSFTHIAELTEIITFDWNWTGNHSTIDSSGALSFITDGESTLLGESDGFGKFKTSGTFSSVITAGTTFGFEVTGQHMDAAQKLRGRIQIYNVSSEAVQAVPASATPVFILALLGLGISRIRANQK